MSVTLAKILSHIEAELSTVAGLAKSMNYNELTEGVNDLPALQVYPDSYIQDIANSTTERTTFSAGVRQSQYIIFCDLYARQRSQIAEDMAKLVDLVDAMSTVFEAQHGTALFNLPEIRAFHWEWKRVIFDYAGVQYMGARFTLTLRVF